MTGLCKAIYHKEVKIEKEKLVLFFLGLILYLTSVGISYASFSFLRPGVGTKEPPINNQAKNGKFVVPVRKYADLPKTEECPINGAMYSKPEKDLWEKRRPLGVMIENSKAARPQSGISSADVVYEAIAEGGISRILSVFYCQDADFIGPVRSARTYYIDWISEYADFPLYAHVGGANQAGPADALGQIGRYGWEAFNDLSQFSIGFPTFWRDYERLGPDTATEHTVYSSTTKLWDFAAKKRKLTNTSIDDQTGKEVPWNVNFTKWQFKEGAVITARPDTASADFALSGAQASYASDYTIRWQYDHDSNSYLRSNGGAEHRDLNTNQQLLAKNIILMFTTISVADDGYLEEGHGSHLLYGTKGTGKAKFLLDGKVIDGTWSKLNRTSRTKFLDQSGQEMKFNRGQIWIEVLPIGQPLKIS